MCGNKATLLCVLSVFANRIIQMLAGEKKTKIPLVMMIQDSFAICWKKNTFDIP